MNYYIDIRILPSPEFSDSLLMNELFLLLHKSLVMFGQGEVGVSFPNVNKALGDILRLHGHQSSLQRLMATPWIGGLMDYITISETIKIPDVVGYRVVKRIQAKSSSERLIRRSVRKGWLTEEEAILKIHSKSERKLSFPYLRMKSQSTRQMFRIFIEHGPILTNSVTGEFTAYGLSSNATIPWF